MGYRSDVKMVTTKKGWEYIKKRLVEKFGEECWLLHPDAEPIGDGKYVLFVADDQKWYENYDSAVRVFMNALADLEDEGEPYQFARAGESVEDNVEDANNIAYEESHYDMPRVEVVRKVEVRYSQYE